MKTLSQAIASFDPIRADKNTIQDQFWTIAEVALYGGYFLVNGETRIYPVEIEFYLYVENDPKGKWQQDANMYHKGKGVPYFPKEGSLYPHRSGVDYTFENEEQKYRASFLIRSYQYEAGGEIIKNPTYLWEDIFGYNSIDGKGLTIRWVDEPDGVLPTRKQGKRINLKDGKGKADEKLWRFIKIMPTPHAPQPDYDAIAHQAYEWLKKRRAKREISTIEVLMKINGYKWGDKEQEQLEGLDLFEVHERLLRLIKKGKEYVADFSAYEGMFVGVPYNIPFVFRKK